MTRPIPKRPHPKHDAIVSLLLGGATCAEVVRKLRCDKTAVSRIRGTLKLPDPHPPKTIEQKWRERAVPREGGHMGWAGKYNNGTPVVRHNDRDYSARAIAFTIQTGRAPQGNVLADCGLKECVAPQHMMDAASRTEIREQVRFLRGLPARKETCSKGHDQKTYGRYDTDGCSYCSFCNTERQAKITTLKRGK